VFILLGVTTGDDLIRSEKFPLAASEDLSAVEAQKVFHESEKIRLADLIASAPYGVRESVYQRFEIVECASA
jgi:hypothetical protein